MAASLASSAVAVASRTVAYGASTTTAGDAAEEFERLMHPGAAHKLDGPLPWELPDPLKHSDQFISICSNWQKHNPGLAYSHQLLLASVTPGADPGAAGATAGELQEAGAAAAAPPSPLRQQQQQHVPGPQEDAGGAWPTAAHPHHPAQQPAHEAHPQQPADVSRDGAAAPAENGGEVAAEAAAPGAEQLLPPALPSDPDPEGWALGGLEGLPHAEGAAQQPPAEEEEEARAPEEGPLLSGAAHTSSERQPRGVDGAAEDAAAVHPHTQAEEDAEGGGPGAPAVVDAEGGAGVAAAGGEAEQPQQAPAGGEGEGGDAFLSAMASYGYTAEQVAYYSSEAWQQWYQALCEQYYLVQERLAQEESYGTSDEYVQWYEQYCVAMQHQQALQAAAAAAAAQASAAAAAGEEEQQEQGVAVGVELPAAAGEEEQQQQQQGLAIAAGQDEEPAPPSASEEGPAGEEGDATEADAAAAPAAHGTLQEREEEQAPPPPAAVAGLEEEEAQAVGLSSGAGGWEVSLEAGAPEELEEQPQQQQEPAHSLSPLPPGASEEEPPAGAGDVLAAVVTTAGVAALVVPDGEGPAEHAAAAGEAQAGPSDAVADALASEALQQGLSELLAREQEAAEALALQQLVEDGAHAPGAAAAAVVTTTSVAVRLEPPLPAAPAEQQQLLQEEEERWGAQELAEAVSCVHGVVRSLREGQPAPAPTLARALSLMQRLAQEPHLVAAAHAALAAHDQALPPTTPTGKARAASGHGNHHAAPVAADGGASLLHTPARDSSLPWASAPPLSDPSPTSEPSPPSHPPQQQDEEQIVQQRVQAQLAQLEGELQAAYERRAAELEAAYQARVEELERGFEARVGAATEELRRQYEQEVADLTAQVSLAEAARHVPRVLSLERARARPGPGAAPRAAAVPLLLATGAGGRAARAVRGDASRAGRAAAVPGAGEHQGGLTDHLFLGSFSLAVCEALSGTVLPRLFAHVPRDAGGRADRGHAGGRAGPRRRGGPHRGRVRRNVGRRGGGRGRRRWRAGGGRGPVLTRAAAPFFLSSVTPAFSRSSLQAFGVHLPLAQPTPLLRGISHTSSARRRNPSRAQGAARRRTHGKATRKIA